MWQALREELHPDGLEIVTVGMDTAGAEACRPFIEAASPTHPSLVDVGHVMAERFGVVNIPNGLWIDEDGVVVRPAEPAFPPGRRGSSRDAPPPEGLPEHMREILHMSAVTPAFCYGGMPYADAERSMRLFAEACLPELLSWDTEPLALSAAAAR